MVNKALKNGAVFSDLGLSPKILARLEQMKFDVPTPIQVQAIPIAAEGKDVIGIAQTGTGKTLAFGLPLLQQVARTGKRALIIVPTRELAIQVDEALQIVGQPLGFRTTVLIGGGAMRQQIEQIRRQPHILIGTPGRLIDHLESKRLPMASIGVLVLDEADRMLDMGFMPQINQILKHVPRERQTMLFSATMPPEIVRIATEHMKMPVRIEVAPAGTVAERVQQEIFVVQKGQKNPLLEKLLAEYAGTVLVFSRTKYGAKRICRTIQDMGHSAAEIHSNLSLAQRRKALTGFKTGKHRVLVATDIAARGIDVTNIELVINYDLPDNPDDYVHRVGRTGRAGKIGRAISFVTPDQRGKIRLIERIVRQSLRISRLPDGLPTEQRESHSAPHRSRGPMPRHSHGQRRRNSSGGRPQSGRRHVRVHH